jgi:hypothetical protein
VMGRNRVDAIGVDDAPFHKVKGTTPVKVCFLVQKEMKNLS